MGVGQIAVLWFNSHLSGRQQLVNIEDTNSNFRNVLCGVPQGSILGPLLFLVYVNDMKAAVKCKLLLYADDCTFSNWKGCFRDRGDSQCGTWGS